MARGSSTLRLYLLDDRRVDLDRAAGIVERPAAIRAVVGLPPEWSVLHETGNLTEAMRTCAADLDAVDPDWLGIFDFRAWEAGRTATGA